MQGIARFDLGLILMTIITKTTGGTTRSQREVPGPTCQEATMPKRSNTRENTGNMIRVEANIRAT